MAGSDESRGGFLDVKRHVDYAVKSTPHLHSIVQAICIGEQKVTAVTINALKVTGYFFQKIHNRPSHFKVVLLTAKVTPPR